MVSTNPSGVVQKYSMPSNNYLKFETRLKALESAYKRPTSSYAKQNQFIRFNNQVNHQKGESTMLNRFLKNGCDYGQKALTTRDGQTNAILLPAPTQDFVEKAIPDYSPLRKISRITSVATDGLELLLDKGMGDVGWVLEMGKREETEAPELTKLVINTHEMFAKPKASQKLLDDASVDLENWLAEKIAAQMGVMETHAFVNGDGKGKPTGFLTYPKTEFGKAEWGKIETMPSLSEGKIEDSDVLVEVFHGLKPEYLQGACWVMSRATLAMVRKLKDKDGHYVWLPHMSSDIGSTLLGYPVILCDSMPKPEKGSFSIAFGNFKEGYQIVDRQDIQLLRDPYSAKPYVEFYATKRVGGDVINTDAIKLIQF